MTQLNKETFLPVLSGPVYTNPVYVSGIGGKEPVTAVHPDPYVLKYNGEYYAYLTGARGVSVMHATSLDKWEHRGYAFQMEGEKEYWAPAVVYENGLFYMYVSTMPEGEEDVHFQRLKVAVSKKADGPFIYAKTLFDTFSIDAHVVKDPKGEFTLFYSVNDYAGIDSHRPGTVILADKLIDLLTLESKPVLIVAPTLDEEIYEENRFGDGRNWHTIEGAFYLKRRNRHYMMYSGNAYVRPNYFIGYSVADDQSGLSLKEQPWRKFPSPNYYVPLLRKNEGVEGVGHNSVIQAPNNVDNWVIYHGRDAHQELDYKKEQRVMRIDPLLWDGDKMWVPGPTYSEQEVPAMPEFRELFDGTSSEALSTQWQTIGGNWILGGGEVCQTEKASYGGLLTKSLFTHGRFEASMKWHADHSGGLYGVYACYQNAANYVQILFDAGKRKLVANAVMNSIEGPSVEAELSSSFDFTAYHNLLIDKLGGTYNVTLDGVQVLKASFPVEHGSFGLCTRYSSASFDGVAVTSHMALTPDNEQEFLRFISQVSETGSCKAVGGSLRCRSGQEPLELRLLAGLDARSFQFQVDVTWQSATRKVGLIIGAADDGLEVMLDRQTQRLRVVHCQGSQRAVGFERSWAAPEQQDLSVLTLAAKVRNGRIWIRLGTEIMYTGALSLSDSTIGLTAEGELAFSGIEWTLL